MEQIALKYNKYTISKYNSDLTDLWKMTIYTTQDFRAELSFKSGSGRNGNNERCMERESGVEDPYRTCTGTHQ